MRDEIRFGYNATDDVSASHVLGQGIGQCNTKTTLLIALLRATGMLCRLHGFAIHRQLKDGAIPSWLLRLAPEEILHSWVEVYHDGRWHNLEGFILDRPYLAAVQNGFPTATGRFCGYGIDTIDFPGPTDRMDRQRHLYPARGNRPRLRHLR